MIDEVRDMCDELEHIIKTLQDLSSDIKHYQDIAEQLNAIWCDAIPAKNEVEEKLNELETAEEEELKDEYRRSVI